MPMAETAVEDEIRFSRYEPAREVCSGNEDHEPASDRDLRSGVFRTDERRPLAAFIPSNITCAAN